MTTVAKFLVEDIFRLQLRGLVISGLIIDGVINTGDYICFDPNNQFQIKDFGGIREQKNIPLIGLLIGDVILPKADLNKIKGQTLTIVSQ